MPRNFKPKTGSGDLGFTDLFGGRRVAKTDRRVKLNALLDELVALLGLAKTGFRAGAARDGLTAAQRALVQASGVIAGMKRGLGAETRALEALTAAAAARLKPQKKFVLPGANETEAMLHLARTRARACEILAWELKAKEPAVLLNRLSDYLFLAALARAKAPRPAGAR